MLALQDVARGSKRKDARFHWQPGCQSKVVLVRSYSPDDLVNNEIYMFTLVRTNTIRPMMPGVRNVSGY